jgi:hypothetical protein
MEVHILDALLRPVEVVDQFESMIWAERWVEVGDFHLVTLSTFSNRRRFVAGTRIMINLSKRIMEIMTVEERIDENRRRVLDIKGRELTHLLEARAAIKAVGTAISPVWVFTAITPPNIMRQIFNDICVLGTVSETDIIPFVTAGTLYPADTIPEPITPIDWEQKPESVLAALKELGTIYDLGIRLYKDPTATILHFNVYAGSDRTSAQTTLPAVIFAHDLENLANTTEYTDFSNAYNVVRVIYTYTIPATETEPEEEITLSTEVYDGTEAPEGLDRRVKILIVSNVPEEVTDIPAYLIQSARDELMKSRPISAFDGEVSRNSGYVYERDYYMGDLVEQRSETGGTAYVRVEEYIFVQDKQGERSYPTLVTRQYKEPGTWGSFKYDVDWDLFPPDEDWDDQ